MKKIYGYDDIYLDGINIDNNLIPYIPEIDEKELRELYKKIKPITTINGRKYLLKHYLMNSLRNTSYYWVQDRDKTRRIKDEDIKTIEEFICLHKFSICTDFKPSIAEILSQVPKHLIDEIDYFEIVEVPKDIYDVKRYPEAYENGYHLSRVRTYKNIRNN